MTIKKTVKPKTTDKSATPRKPRAKAVAKPDAPQQEPVQTTPAIAPVQKGMDTQYVSILQKLMHEPDQGLFITISNNTATINGFNCDISHVVNMAALALYKAYDELDQESKNILSLQQAATAFINKLSEIANNQGASNAGNNNQPVQTTSESGH